MTITANYITQMERHGIMMIVQNELGSFSFGIRTFGIGRTQNKYMPKDSYLKMGQQDQEIDYDKC